MPQNAQRPTATRTYRREGDESPDVTPSTLSARRPIVAGAGNSGMSPTDTDSLDDAVAVVAKVVLLSGSVVCWSVASAVECDGFGRGDGGSTVQYFGQEVEQGDSFRVCQFSEDRLFDSPDAGK